MAEVKLLGTWASPFSCRVKLGLKLKGIPYEYIEEDVLNKSPLLLHYNPIHKKVPVLVPEGQPICESMLILEYIDEVWPQNALLPNQPYEKTLVRFWVNFVEDKVIGVWKAIFGSSGEDKEKAVKDSLGILKTMEEECLGDKKFFGGEKIGMVDVAFGVIPHWFEVLEEMEGVKLFDPHRFPRMHAWRQKFLEEPIIKENLPDPHALLVFFKSLREMLVASPK